MGPGQGMVRSVRRSMSAIREWRRAAVIARKPVPKTPPAAPLGRLSRELRISGIGWPNRSDCGIVLSVSLQEGWIPWQRPADCCQCSFRSVSVISNLLPNHPRPSLIVSLLRRFRPRQRHQVCQVKKTPGRPARASRPS